MDFSVLEPHLFRNVHLYAPEEQGRCDLLIAGGKIVAIEKTDRAAMRLSLIHISEPTRPY